jgi:excinuclease ABC subunit A
MKEAWIVVNGAREHNLKNISLKFPRNKFVVIAGPSGAGKSSLLFDTLDRYSRRHFGLAASNSALKRGVKSSSNNVNVDSIRGLPFVYGFKTRLYCNDLVSFATLTELYDYLRLFYFNFATAICPKCNSIVENQNINEIIKFTDSIPENTEIEILAPLGLKSESELQSLIKKFLLEGFVKVRIDGEYMRLEEANWHLANTDIKDTYKVELLLDIFPLTTAKYMRLLEVVELAQSLSEGDVLLKHSNSSTLFSEKLKCIKCNYTLEPRQLSSFTYYMPTGGCSMCYGNGIVIDNESEIICPMCNGARLKVDFSNYILGGLSFGELMCKNVNDAFFWAKQYASKFQHTSPQYTTALKQLIARLERLHEIGLGHIELTRSVNSLSSGEIQRAEIARQLGASLQGVLFLFDEPSVGLHPRDTEMLINVCRKIIDAGNSILISEHDTNIIRASDYVVELGPGAGNRGGEIVFSGIVSELIKTQTKTSRMMRGEYDTHPKTRGRSKDLLSWVSIQGARKHNLNNIRVSFPMQALSSVCGLSGSGKSSLVIDSFVPAIKYLIDRRSNSDNLPKDFCIDSISGWDKINRVIDSSARVSVKNRRATVATTSGVLSPIRYIFSQTIEAKALGYKAGDFSYNGAGCCPSCKGYGYQYVGIEWHEDEALLCEECNGTRFKRGVLDITYRGCSIAKLLSYTIDEAALFFKNVPQVYKPLCLLSEVGLGYLLLSQITSSLSHGEFQRLRLAADIYKMNSTQTVYVFDEPSQGLHASDVKHLISLFYKLISDGNTVIVLEHNTEIIKASDYIVELGPGAGKEGGNVIAKGTLREICLDEHSIIKSYL